MTQRPAALEKWRSAAAVPAMRGVVIGLLVGGPLLVFGLVVPGRFVIGTTIPVLDTAAITCLLLTAVVAALDSQLSSDRQSLPTVSVCLAAAVMWAVHLVLFPGDLPSLHFPNDNAATSSVFLTINLTLPIMLVIALLQGGGHLRRPMRALILSVAAGAATGVAISLGAILAANIASTVSANGRFNATEGWIGGASLFPAVVGIAVYLSGRRGDERVSGGVAAALVLQACNSILLAFLGQRYTTAWYVDHVLSLLAPVALLSGQMVIFVGALGREQRAAASLRTSLDMAEALARETDLGALIEKLIESAMTAVNADRATLMTLDGDELQIESSIDRRGTPGPVGRRLPVTALQVDGIPVVLEAVRTSKPIATPAYETHLLAADHAASVGGVRHYITWPLFLGGQADAILFLARREDDPFDADDTRLLSEFAAIAALLLRNARLLRAAEAASVAKSNFLNLAAHELRTPISVIRGYVDLLAGGDLGPVPEWQDEAMEVLRAKSEELIGHVNQLLAASRLEAKIDAPPEEHRLGLRAACVEAIARVKARGDLLGAEIELLPGEEVHLHTSPAAVALILVNLINNALTYSRPPAQVRIEVGADDGPRVRVVDSGIGIPADQQGNVFERFHRVDRPDFAFPGGTGLGLYIARQHAEAIGGTLALDWSEIDVGSAFVLRLPPAESPSARGLILPAGGAADREIDPEVRSRP